MTRVKICGLKTEEALDAAIDAGADYVGLVFFPKSPRHVSTRLAAKLAARVPDRVTKTALVVNPTDAELSDILNAVPIDLIQLHGSETPERAAEIRAKFSKPVMKALGIAEHADLAKLDAYTDHVDQILVDAKPPSNGPLPGGNGLAFDWTLISDQKWQTPWMLAGGLTPKNVASAIKLTAGDQVDVSSGVEASPGEKSATLIREFISAAKAAE